MPRVGTIADRLADGLADGLADELADGLADGLGVLSREVGEIKVEVFSG